MKVTPYTGYKVNSYQTIYDKDGKVIDSPFEASSNYKVRNKVILQAPAASPAAEQRRSPPSHRTLRRIPLFLWSQQSLRNLPRPLTFLSNRRSRRNRNRSAPQLVCCKAAIPIRF